MWAAPPHFACVLAITWPDGVHAVYEGRADGKLTWPPRGKLGFGFDPVFVPLGHEQTSPNSTPPRSTASATAPTPPSWWPISSGDI
jgi:inosine/xanthosine triphosphate pyrophosphatase family protein